MITLVLARTCLLSLLICVVGIYICIYVYGAVQIEHFTGQHRIALQLCVAHCLCSLSTLRCGVEKSLRTTNETIFPAHITLSAGSACQNALCSANDATKAETAAVRRLNMYIYGIYVSLHICDWQVILHILARTCSLSLHICMVRARVIT